MNGISYIREMHENKQRIIPEYIRWYREKTGTYLNALLLHIYLQLYRYLPQLIIQKYLYLFTMYNLFFIISPRIFYDTSNPYLIRARLDWIPSR